jgi:hypothetical protein
VVIKQHRAVLVVVARSLQVEVQCALLILNVIGVAPIIVSRSCAKDFKSTIFYLKLLLAFGLDFFLLTNCESFSSVVGSCVEEKRSDQCSGTIVSNSSMCTSIISKCNPPRTNGGKCICSQCQCPFGLYGGDCSEKKDCLGVINGKNPTQSTKRRE